MELKRIILFTVIIIICIIAIITGVYAQFIYRYNNPSDILFGNLLTSEEYDSTYDDLKAEFDTIFTNTFNSETNITTVKKTDANKEIVFTETEFSNTVSGKYEVNVKIPNINIDHSNAININKRIKELFKDKVNSIVQQQDLNTRYMVDYVSYINGDILSLVIRANLKEGNNVQRTIIQTFNYNITTNQNVTLQELLNLKGVTLVKANEKIKEEIKQINIKAEALINAGYSVFTRDVNSDMYNIDNTYNYFMGDEQYLYIIYAYGNIRFTTEVDLVIF